MSLVFDTIGLDIPNEAAVSSLAERVGFNGRQTRIVRRNGILHGRCWEIGAGLEIWTLFYERQNGDLLYTDCRPAFRSRFSHRLSPWALTEFDDNGEAFIHGYLEETQTEVLFQLQNLTEATSRSFQKDLLQVGLSGIAYHARAEKEKKRSLWKNVKNLNVETDWHLRGEILALDELTNPLSGNCLVWIHVQLDGFRLEIVANKRNISGELKVGETICADIWLQGHIKGASTSTLYEGIDFRVQNSSMWQKLRRRN